MLASRSTERRRVSFLASELERRAGDGSAIGRISIPSIGASFVVVKGTSAGALQGGPGIYPETGFPGIPGTTAIAGHRTTYLAPFRHIDALHRGNRILLNMPYAQLTYSVIGQRIVRPTNVQAAVANVGYTRLVLSACTPLFSAAKRLLVFARLTRTVPVGAGRLPLTRAKDLADSARTYGNVATVAFIAGGALAAVGALLFVTAPTRGDSDSPSSACSTDSAFNAHQRAASAPCSTSIVAPTTPGWTRRPS